ncbi:MAG TPA: VWA domain-containing protein [Pyrinomonadaceae bacterium]|nr:VWA domain-containing protein [Pyrinomonadaceae bacterium]
MPYSTFTIVRFGFALLLGLCLLAPSIQAQQKQEQAPAEQEDEVIRINTQLVQTDVMVFDKQGHFVDNLKGDQFELRVDGKPVQVSFFDKIVAGGSSEEAQLAAARGVASANDSAKPIPLDRGRTIFFFLDDMHLASDSMVRARKALLNFIDKEMGQNDQVGIASASGQIGFLQQLTNNKAVLRAAVARLNFRPYDVRDMDRPPMSVYQGFEINERSNQELLNYFVEQLQSEIPMLTRDRAEQLVKERADAMLQQAAAVTTNSLASLESLARSSAPLPGRKIIFFLSDGFVITNRVSNMPEKLRRITDAAARTGVVIYTMEARGLMTGMPDASVEMRGDPSGRVATAAIGEISTEQEPLRTLAADTGGRALLNTNSLGAGIKNTLQETSVYYLLAWRPEADVKGGGKFRKIEASIKGHPELTVRVRRGYYDVAPGPIATRKPAGVAPSAVKTPEEELRKTLGAVYPKTELPTMLAVNYMDMPNVGPVVTTTMQVMGNTPPSESIDGKPAQAMIYVAGVLFNDQGKAIASFQNRLGITRNTTNPPASTTAIPPPIFYTYQFHAPPGLYQVRVAAREEKSGRTGSATEWIEIPDFTSGSLAMSSLLIGERKQAAQEETKTVSGAISDISVDHRFTKTSHLRFLTYVYNAGRVPAGNGVPNVTLQIQVLRDDRPVITTPLRKVATEGIADMARLPYAAEISLAALPVGQYILKVTAIDLINKKSTTQRASFEIE